MSYYPVVGDICRFENDNGTSDYLIMDVREEGFINHKQIVAHLLCLNDGEQIPDYIWTANNIYWRKVA